VSRWKTPATWSTRLWQYILDCGAEHVHSNRSLAEAVQVERRLVAAMVLTWRDRGELERTLVPGGPVLSFKLRAISSQGARRHLKPKAPKEKGPDGAGAG
jgi:hypothetical protein